MRSAAERKLPLRTSSRNVRMVSQSSPAAREPKLACSFSEPPRFKIVGILPSSTAIIFQETGELATGVSNDDPRPRHYTNGRGTDWYRKTCQTQLGHPRTDEAVAQARRLHCQVSGHRNAAAARARGIRWRRLERGRAPGGAI